MMDVKRILVCLLIMAGLFWVPTNTVAQDNPPDDPVMTETTVDDVEGDRYTKAEFDALSDEDKLDVYLNFPHLLPENFQPADYWDILHPGQSAR